MVARLPVAQRQLLEVVRAIHRDAKYLLLDEPTTALEQNQIDELLEIIRRLTPERDIGVLFIDHKLDEVYAVADYIVGLANGQIVLRGDARSLAREDVVEAIVGAGEEGRRKSGKGVGVSRNASPPQGGDRSGEAVFEVRGLAGNGLMGSASRSSPAKSSAYTGWSARAARGFCARSTALSRRSKARWPCAAGHSTPRAPTMQR